MCLNPNLCKNRGFVRGANQRNLASSSPCNLAHVGRPWKLIQKFWKKFLSATIKGVGGQPVNTVPVNALLMMKGECIGGALLVSAGHSPLYGIDKST